MRYKVTADGKNAFVIEPNDENVTRTPVRVALNKNKTGVVVERITDHNPCATLHLCDRDVEVSPFGVDDPERHTGGFKLHAYHGIIEFACKQLWTHPTGHKAMLAVEPGPPRQPGEPFRRPFKGMRKWVFGQTGKSICKRFHVEWKRLLAQCDQQILDMDKRLFSCTGKKTAPPVILNPAFWENKHLVSDVMNFRAAAQAVDHSFSLLRDRTTEAHLDRLRQNLPKIEGVGGGILRFLNVDWKMVFAYDFQPYTSLNKTLMNFPHMVSLQTLRGMSECKLPKPYYDKLELIVAVNGPYQIRRRHDYHLIQEADDINLRPFLFCTRDQIKEAIRLVAEHVQAKPNYRKTSQIIETLIFICDAYTSYDDSLPPYRGTSIVTMARNSIRWHNDLANREIVREQRWARENEERQRILENPESETAKPPIDLPDSPHVRFLSTVQAVKDEGTLMGNCVAGYAYNAIQGNCFLFHIDYKEEMATVEITETGEVRQSKGPKNLTNIASEWGKQYLGRWGRNFKRPNYF